MRLSARWLPSGSATTAATEGEDAATLVLRPGCGWRYDHRPAQYVGIGVQVDGKFLALDGRRLPRQCRHADPYRAMTLDALDRRLLTLLQADARAATAELARRLGVARTLLRRGLPLKQVAAEVGYANASALGRIFSQRLGCSPAAWQRADSDLRSPVAS